MDALPDEPIDVLDLRLEDFAVFDHFADVEYSEDRRAADEQRCVGEVLA